MSTISSRSDWSDEINAFYLFAIIVAIIVLSLLLQCHKDYQTDTVFKVSGNTHHVYFWGGILLIFYCALFILFNSRVIQSMGFDIENSFSALEIAYINSTFLFIIAIAISIAYGTQKQKTQGDLIVLVLVWVLFACFFIFPAFDTPNFIMTFIGSRLSRNNVVDMSFIQRANEAAERYQRYLSSKSNFGKRRRRRS